jgi:hypothetical protein
VKKDYPSSQKPVDGSKDTTGKPDQWNKDNKPTGNQDSTSKPAVKINCDFYGGRNIKVCEAKGQG